MDLMDRLTVSPCSNPELPLDDVLAAYSNLGYRSFEVFTGWAKSAFDINQPPEGYLELGRRYGMRFHSMHLPPVEDDLDATLDRAVRAARFAEALGVKVVLFKATSRENYIRAARPFLDAIAGVAVTPVLQNHAGTPISTLGDFNEVLQGIADPRMATLLEVGQFHSVGVSWRTGYHLLGSTIALVHVKDQIGRQSVPFGAGEIDLPGLFAHMESVGYAGNYVVEMEVEDKENTLRYLSEARAFIRTCCTGGEAGHV
jgi:sugar phosphate isomerase/epimerase